MAAGIRICMGPKVSVLVGTGVDDGTALLALFRECRVGGRGRRADVHMVRRLLLGERRSRRCLGIEAEADLENAVDVDVCVRAEVEIDQAPAVVALLVGLVGVIRS